MLEKLALAGMDVARLNFSHGDHAYHSASYANIIAAGKKSGKKIAVLQDLGGPKIRLGTLNQPELELDAGGRVTLVSGQSAPGDEIPVNYPYLAEDVAVGEKILLADGLVELLVEERKSHRLICSVVTGGILHSHKGVNLPSSKLRVSAFTDKDRSDLTFGLSLGVDMVALSFVRDESDLAPIREILKQSANPPLLFAKIEKPQAIDRIAEILAVVDGIMVARGDLGVEMPYEMLPMAQKKLISAARRAGKPVIVATQMLRSMIESPRPTRAEATDVANAILDGADAVMLSEETAIGRYPLESVGALDRIALTTEKEFSGNRFLHEEDSPLLPPVEAAISRAACEIALKLGAKAIVASTLSGKTARLVSRFRPPIPILGVTSVERTVGNLAISWGVTPAMLPHTERFTELCAMAEKYAKENGFAVKGDSIVITAGYPVKDGGSSDLVKVLTVK
jgi:pyruvate kinase